MAPLPSLTPPLIPLSDPLCETFACFCFGNTALFFDGISLGVSVLLVAEA
jgi:hypothetical protein